MTATRGMLDLKPDKAGNVRCCRSDCGWEGQPTYANGEALTECPRCEGAGNEIDLRENPLRYDVHAGEQGVWVPNRPVPQRRAATAPGRNDPCDCGSGRKSKKCCHR